MCRFPLFLWQDFQNDWALVKSYNSALEKYCTFPQEKMDQLLHGNCAAWLWKKLLSAKWKRLFFLFNRIHYWRRKYF